MKKLAFAIALATGVTVAAGGQALAQGPAAGPSGPDAAACTASATPASAPDTGTTPTVNATGGTGADVHNLKVFACNGVRVGTAISTSTGPGGTVLTIAPDANFLNGSDSFQVSAKGAATNDQGIMLAMTDTALRASIASAAPGGVAAPQQ